MRRREFLGALGTLGAAMMLRGDRPMRSPLDRLSDPYDMNHKIFGMALGSWWWANEDMSSFGAYLRRMAGEDCDGKRYMNFLQVHLTYELPDIRRPEIIPLGEQFPDRQNRAGRMDQHVAMIIDSAHALGLGVLLKPHLAPRVDGGLVDRARIDYGTDGRAWEAFFSNYTMIMRRYARLAREHDVEMLAYACELQGTLGRTRDWRRVIDAIRDEGFLGRLMYTGLKTRRRDKTPFLLGDDDAHRIIELSDFVCPHFYGPLGSAQDWSVGRLRDDFAQVLAMYEQTAVQHQKTVLMTETGTRPIRAQCANPWEQGYSETFPEDPHYDERMQVRWIDAIVLDSLASPLVKGMFWWDAISDYRPRQLGEKHLRRTYQQTIRTSAGHEPSRHR